ATSRINGRKITVEKKMALRCTLVMNNCRWSGGFGRMAASSSEPESQLIAFRKKSRLPGPRRTKLLVAKSESPKITARVLGCEGAGVLPSAGGGGGGAFAASASTATAIVSGPRVSSPSTKSKLVAPTGRV